MVLLVYCTVLWSGMLVLALGRAGLGHGSDCSQDIKQIIPHIKVVIFILQVVKHF